MVELLRCQDRFDAAELLYQLYLISKSKVVRRAGIKQSAHVVLAAL